MPIDPARLARIRARILVASAIAATGCGAQQTVNQPPTHTINERPPEPGGEPPTHTINERPRDPVAPPQTPPEQSPK